MKIKLLAFLFCFALILSSCHNTVPETPLGSAAEDEDKNLNSIEGISVRVSDIIISEEEISVVLTWKNETDSSVTYGDMFYLEMYQNGEWLSCAPGESNAFYSIGYELAPNTSKNKTYNISNYYTITEPGDYRIYTNCSVVTGEESQICNLYADFSMNPNFNTVDNDDQPANIAGDIQYIRTDGGYDNMYFPGAAIINSAEDLSNYYEENKNDFDLGHKETVYSDTTIGFVDACEKYGEEFFRNNYLVFITLMEGSGSIRHEVVEKVFYKKTLSVYINPIVPEVGTCDMATWHIIMEIPREYSVTETENLLVYYDGRLAHGTIPEQDKNDYPVHGYDGSDNLSSPPDNKLIYDGNSIPGTLWGYYWEQGETAVIADIPHPLDSSNNFTCEIIQTNEGCIVFTEGNPSVTAVCWKAEDIGNTSAPSAEVKCEKVSPDQYNIQLYNGSYIYYVTANFEGEGYKGTANYVFYVEVQQ